MHLDIAPETERLVREEMDRGHLRSVDELIRAGVERWREKQAPLHAKAATPETARHISAVILEIMSDVPAEDMAQMPRDGTSQDDHYIYGLPKREQ